MWGLVLCVCVCVFACVRAWRVCVCVCVCCKLLCIADLYMLLLSTCNCSVIALSKLPIDSIGRGTALTKGGVWYSSHWLPCCWLGLVSIHDSPRHPRYVNMNWEVWVWDWQACVALQCVCLLF